MTSTTRETGLAGEELAVRTYRRRGYRVVERNWRRPQGEIDLIVRRGRTLVIAEVKSRTTSAYGMPKDAVDRTKQLRIKRLALAWREHSNWSGAIRFDIVEVLDGVVTIHPSAF